MACREARLLRIGVSLFSPLLRAWTCLRQGALCTPACGRVSVTCGDSSPKGGAKAYFHQHTQKERSCLSPRERWQCRKALTERGCRGAMPFIAPPYTTQTCIGAFLPLPSGEVAMPSGIDGEGAWYSVESIVIPSQSPAVTAPPKGGAKACSRLHPHRCVLASPRGRGGGAQR